MTGRLAAALAVVLATFTLVPITAQAADGPTRVMIVGDSVTQGYRGDVTWRYFLWHALRTAGDDVDFVGPRQGTFYLHPDGRYDWDYRGEDAYADADFDQDHGAWYGGRLGEHNNWFYVPLAPQVQEQQPDVIVSMWGINDLSDDDQGPAELIASYRAWIAEARSVKPDVDFVIGRLQQTWLYDGEVTAFNALLGDLSVELSTDASRVLVTSMNEPYVPEADTFDGIHPDLSGQAKIAGMLGGSLHALLTGADAGYGPLPVPPSPVASVPSPVPVAIAPQGQQASPRPPRRVRATRHGPRVRVTWRKVGSADAYRVRCGARGTRVTGTRTFLRARARSCAVRSLGAGGASAWKKVRVRPARPAG
jgi:hypothetical protein